MALDERKEGDDIMEIDDYTIVLEEDLIENFDSFTIDYSDSWLKRGFSVASNIGSGSCS